MKHTTPSNRFDRVTNPFQNHTISTYFQQLLIIPLPIRQFNSTLTSHPHLPVLLQLLQNPSTYSLGPPFCTSLETVRSGRSSQTRIAFFGRRDSDAANLTGLDTRTAFSGGRTFGETPTHGGPSCSFFRFSRSRFFLRPPSSPLHSSPSPLPPPAPSLPPSYNRPSPRQLLHPIRKQMHGTETHGPRRPHPSPLLALPCLQPRPVRRRCELQRAGSPQRISRAVPVLDDGAACRCGWSRGRRVSCCCCGGGAAGVPGVACFLEI
jgi:hypothetical protein